MSLCALTSPKATHQQGLLVISQSLLSQVTLPLDLQLQGLRDVGNHPVNDTQDEEHHMLRMSTHTLLLGNTLYCLCYTLHALTIIITINYA